MTPRSIALQGIGYGALVVALQGFGPTEPVIPPNVVVGPRGEPQARELPINLSLARRLDEDELMLAIIVAAVECGLLENQ